MSKRLQVVMDETDLERYRRRAEQEGLSLSEWVRRALEEAVERKAEASPRRRLSALERALECGHPTGDMDEMSREIERGRDLY